jgi:hypothetical protein
MKVSEIKVTLRQLIKDIQYNTARSSKNIVSQTIRYFNTTLDKFRRLAYNPCKNKECKVCAVGLLEYDPIAKGLSKATIENELESKVEA